MAIKHRDTAAGIHGDPRGRTESQWLDTLDYLVARLADATASELHTGRYWICDAPGGKDASLSARVRAKSPLPFLDSDYWEAAVCYTGGPSGAYSDVYAFPFLDGSPVTSKGRIVDRGEDAEIDEFYWLRYSDSAFQPKGWSYPDGNGEWSWIKHPGDEYQQCVQCRLNSSDFSRDGSIMVDILAPHIKSIAAKPRSHPYVPRVSLIHVNRNRENTNLVPWNRCPPRVSSRHVQRLDQLQVSGDTLRVDLARFNIRGGWIAGKYYVSLRLQNFHAAGDWEATSAISEPIRFEIG